MASSSFTDSPATEDADDASKSVTIVINDNGEINYDEKTLQSIIDSNQQTATVTFVRVSGNENGGGDANANAAAAAAAEPIGIVPNVDQEGGVAEDPILMLDQEQINRLENVLKSEEAKDFLGEVLATPGTNLNNSLGDILSGTGMEDIGPPPPLVPSDVVRPSTTTTAKEETDGRSKKLATQKRRSQRQIDRELKEEADRIKRENQELLKKERDALRRQSTGVAAEPEPEPETKVETPAEPVKKSPVAPTGRPKRERKLPAHLKHGDFEYSYGAVEKAHTKSKDEPKAKQEPTPEVKSETLADEVVEEESSQKEEAVNVQVEVKEEVKNVEGAKVGVEVEVEVDDDDDDDDEGSDDWNSEDDPERLWCICQQPHNNRFMICCDSCLDWYHGKCVGITKKMGKEMEQAGNEWRCPKCKQQEEKVATEKQREVLQVKLKEREQVKKKKPPLKRGESKDSKEKKPKERTCFVCEKPPREGSIFCSDSCISKHATRAKELLSRSTPKLGHTAAKSDAKEKVRVLVMEPQTNTMLNGPNAPTEAGLEVWLKSHPTYHVVMPTKDPTSKFYGSSASQFYSTAKKPPLSRPKLPKPLPPALKTTGSKSVDKKLSEYSKQSMSKTVKPTSPSVDSSKKDMKRSLSTSSVGHSHDHDFKRQRKTSESKAIVVHPRVRRDSHNSGSVIKRTPEKSYSDVDPKPIRNNAMKGIKDALSMRISKTPDVSFEKDKLDALVRDVENALYRFYSKDVGNKYKAKYRSLVFNIRDEKNNGLFRKIVNGTITPKNLVAMSPEDMASKELKEWRQAELKHDIEKIKSHELELLQLGEKFVLKSHKGEQVIEKDELASGTHKKAVEEVKLPDEITMDGTQQSPAKLSIGSKTWEHGNHVFEEDCDVCTKKMSLDDFIVDKMTSEKKDDKKSSSHQHHHHSHHHVSSKDKDRAKDKEREKSKSKEKESDKDRHRHHKSGSNSSSSHHHRHSSSSSSSKHRRHSSSGSSSSKKHHKDKDRHHHSRSSSKEKSKVDNASKAKLGLEEQSVDENYVKEVLAEAQEIATKEEVVVPPTPVSIQEPVPEEPKSPSADLAVLKDTSEVSSTVTIKTPEQTAATDTCPTVWKGDINMPDVAKFSVTAHQVSGTTDYLTFDLKESLKIVGRIPPPTVWEYIAQVEESPTKEVLLIRLQPTSHDEKHSYDSFYKYLQQRNRFGVVGNNSKMVKDCYIVALPSTEPINSCLLPLDGPGLDENKSNMLLALIVRTRRKRPIDSDASNRHAVPSKRLREDKAKSTPPMLNDDDIKDMMDMSEEVATYTPTPVTKGKGKSAPYDPATAGPTIGTSSESGTPSTTASPDDNSEVYDPESAFPPVQTHHHHHHHHHEEKKKKIRVEFVSSKKQKTDEDFSSSVESSPSPPPSSEQGPITSTGGGFTEQLAKLTKEIAEQKREIATIAADRKKVLFDKEPTATAAISSSHASSSGTAAKVDSNVPGFQGLPTGIASILFGGSDSSSSGLPPSKAPADGNRDPRRKPPFPSAAIPAPASTLGSMTDADLLAKAAQEMDYTIGPPNQAPPRPNTATNVPVFPPPNPSAPVFPPAIPPARPEMMMSGGPPPPPFNRDNWQPPPEGPPGPWMQGYEPNWPSRPCPPREGEWFNRRGENRGRRGGGGGGRGRNWKEGGRGARYDNKRRDFKGRDKRRDRGSVDDEPDRQEGHVDEPGPPGDDLPAASSEDVSSIPTPPPTTTQE